MACVFAPPCPARSRFLEFKKSSDRNKPEGDPALTSVFEAIGAADRDLAEGAVPPLGMLQLASWAPICRQNLRRSIPQWPRRRPSTAAAVAALRQGRDPFSGGRQRADLGVSACKYLDDAFQEAAQSLANPDNQLGIGRAQGKRPQQNRLHNRRIDRTLAAPKPRTGGIFFWFTEDRASTPASVTISGAKLEYKNARVVFF